MLKKLLSLNPFRKKNDKETNASAQVPVSPLSYFDLVGLNGFEVPANIRDRGYVNEGPIGDYPYRSFILEFGGPSLTTGSLDTLYRGGAINLNFFITKLTRSQAVRLYKQAATDEGSRLINMLKSGNDLEAREAQKSLEAANRLLDEISDGYNDGFLGTCVATVFAQDEKSLDQIGMIMQDNLVGNDHHLRALYNRQRSGYISSLPIANNRLQDKNDRRFFDRTALVAASPFYSSEIPFSPGGVPIGVNIHTGKMEFLNVFAKYLDNYSSLIVGASGSGKSFSNKYITSNQILLGYRIFSIDPDGENGPICRLMGGREVEIREDGDVCINVCALTEEEVEVTKPDGRRVMETIVPLGPKIGQLLKFFDRLLLGLDSEEEQILKRAILDAFTDKGINKNPQSLYETELSPVLNSQTGEIEFKKKRKPEITITDIYCRILQNCAEHINWDTYEYGSLRYDAARRPLSVI